MTFCESCSMEFFAYLQSMSFNYWIMIDLLLILVGELRNFNHENLSFV